MKKISTRSTCKALPALLQYCNLYLDIETNTIILTYTFLTHKNINTGLFTHRYTQTHTHTHIYIYIYIYIYIFTFFCRKFWVDLYVIIVCRAMSFFSVSSDCKTETSLLITKLLHANLHEKVFHRRIWIFKYSSPFAVLLVPFSLNGKRNTTQV